MKNNDNDYERTEEDMKEDAIQSMKVIFFGMSFSIMVVIWVVLFWMCL